MDAYKKETSEGKNIYIFSNGNYNTTQREYVEVLDHNLSGGKQSPKEFKDTVESQKIIDLNILTGEASAESFINNGIQN